MANNETPLEEPPYIRHFFGLLVSLGFLGGFLALTVPSWKSWAEVPCIGFIGSFLSSFVPPSDTEKYPEGKVIADLRLHILYITGGIIAILTLLQTSWKNQVDRRKVEADIQKNEQDAKNEAAKREQDALKSERDHIRQVHAERRSRYTKAVEQLANEKAAVRLGGIYTLVGLVDEWLDDKSLAPEEQQKEGQVIINNLCSYIRSPFPLAAKIEEYEARKELEKHQKSESEKLSEGASLRLHVLLKRFEDSGEYEKPKDITADYAKFHEEQDVRRTIFVEMNKRSNDIIKEKGMAIDTVQEIWSDFDFDFSRAPIFYPLSSLTIEKGNFSSAKFYSNADFRGAVFAQNADFRGAVFAQYADFRGASFTQSADFSGASFTQSADFSGAKFAQYADF
ncbi:pentapeptide repeat-containing protein, partial [Rothia mucilaginosa]|uniref:pentapeptide repeat-containing protein n=1 Tax=Rothia mucilaginosa TaxID=43675 RepID=UPI00066ED0E7